MCPIHFQFFVGSIRVKQARHAIQSLGLNVDKKQVQVNASDDGTIDFATFTYLTGPKLEQRAKALQAFELFDKDDKGIVCFEDLQRVAHELGETMSERELEEMLDDADKEGQGFLSKEDFLNVAETLNL